MDDDNEIDFDELLAQMREKIRRKKESETRSPSASPPPPQEIVNPSDESLAAELAILQSDFDIYQAPFVSHRKILGRAVIRARQFVREMILPVLLRQVSYNAANTRLVKRLSDGIESLREQQAHLEERTAGYELALGEKSKQIQRQQVELRRELIAAQEAGLNEIRAKLESLGREGADLWQQLHAGQAERLQRTQGLRERISRAERKLRRILYNPGDGAREPSQVGVERDGSQAPGLVVESNYFDFQERFRGSEEEVREHQRSYLEYFRGQHGVLDIGCGRGEFLELLREAGISALGVDRDLDMVLLCREKGLEVIHADALAYLENCADASLSGIFSAQVVEHLSPDQLVKLVKLAHNKLRTGGRLVLETLNPESLFVLYRWFWMDLTHQRLIHPQTIEFLLQAEGFREVTSRFTRPPEGPLLIPPLEVPGDSGDALDKFNQATDYLNKLLYGSQEYAVLATK